MRRIIRWEHEKKKKGDHSRLHYQGGWYNCLLLFGGALCCLASAYRQMEELLDGIDGLTLPEHAWAYIVIAAAAFTVCCGSSLLGRLWMRLLPLVLVTVCSVGYYTRHWLQVEDGILYILRMYVEQIAEYYERTIFFPIGIREEAPAALLFWLCVCFFGLFALGAALRRMGILLLLPLAMLTAGLAVGKPLGFESMLWMFAGALALRMYRMSATERVSVRTAQLAWMLGLCLVVVSGCSALTVQVVAKHDEMMKRQLALEDAALALPVWNLFARNGEVTNDRPLGNGAEVLKVTLSDEPTENLYLKDFVADHYENGTWSIDGDAFAAAAQAQGMTAEEAGEWVWNLPGDAIEELLPYGDVMAKRWGGLSHWQGVRIAKPREFEYTISNRNFGKTAPLPYVGSLPSEFTMDGDTAAQKPWMQRSYGGSMVMGGRKGYSLADYVADSCDAMIEESFMGGAEPADENKEWQWYSDFAWKQYVNENAPESVRQWLDEMLAQLHMMDRSDYFAYFRSLHRQRDEEELQNTMRIIYTYVVEDRLSYFGSYSKELDALPAGTDPLDYFLNVSGEGYCVHYASAGTLLLQALGIPARYASGYVVFPNDFEKTPDGYTAVVTDMRAHAWTEIYLEGFGWLPCEMTPGFASGEASGIQSSDSSGAGDSQRPEKPDTTDETKDAQEDEEKEETDQTDDTPDRGKGTAGMMSPEQLIFMCCNLLIDLLAVYFVVCLSADGLRLHRKKQEWRIRQEIDSGHYRTAILDIHRRMYWILSMREFVRGKRLHDDIGYGRALGRLADRLGAVVDADRYMALVRQAYFSEDEMSEEAANFVYEVYDALKGKAL